MVRILTFFPNRYISIIQQAQELHDVQLNEMRLDWCVETQRVWQVAMRYLRMAHFSDAKLFKQCFEGTPSSHSTPTLPLHFLTYHLVAIT